MSDLDALRADLVAQQVALDALMSELSDEQFALATPSPGWTVTDQIGHLTYFDGAAATAISDPAAFAAGAEALLRAAGTEGDGGDGFTLGGFRGLETAELRIESWRSNRRLLEVAAAGLADGARVAWYGPSMGAKSFLTARLMEVWAHGTDVADAVGARLEAGDRLRHIAQLGYITRGWSYAVRGERAPEGHVRLALTSPSGELWTWGADDADDAVRGSAEDFCLVVTQRRHVADTGLETGDLGRDWLVRAQVFAGAPSDPPPPRRPR